MKTTFFLVLLLFTGFGLNAQTVINSAGSTNGSIYYSIGEIAITTISNNDYYLTQGYLQPLDVITSREQETVDNDIIEIFPNPAINIITIKTVWKYSKIRIFNLIGVLQLTENFSDSQIDISKLPVGFYLLELYSDEHKTKKIVSFIKG